MNPLLSPAPASEERIMQLVLHTPHMVKCRADIEQERAIALGDLLQENYFSLNACQGGPYNVQLHMVENRLQFMVRGEQLAKSVTISLPVAPFRGIIKDYFLICESYFHAVSTHDPYKVEAIDMGRRGIHNEGAEMLKKHLADDIAMDFATARRLFTLICVLHIR